MFVLSREITFHSKTIIDGRMFRSSERRCWEGEMTSVVESWKLEVWCTCVEGILEGRCFGSLMKFFKHHDGK